MELPTPELTNGVTVDQPFPDSTAPSGTLLVSLSGVTPGNIVECIFQASVGIGSATGGNFQTTIVVSFDPAAIPPFPATYQRVGNPSSLFGSDAIQALTASGIASVVIPVGATKATFGLIYTATGDGADVTIAFAQMRMKEIPIAQVPVAPPFALTPV
jgi:hypothetical protein